MENFKQVLKKTTAVLMIAVLLIGIAPFGSLADMEWSEFSFKASAAVEGDFEYSVNNNQATITGYNGAGGNIVIPSELGGYPVTDIGAYAFYSCAELTGVKIPNSIINIGACAFEDCVVLTSIEIPDSVTSIGAEAFRSCLSLTSIEIPDSVTSIGSRAFINGYSLTNIEIPDSVTRIGLEVCKGSAYYNDESNWTENVLYIGNHLIEAKETISGAYSVREKTKTIADYAFFHCSYLTSIEIPDSVTNIGYAAFWYCSGVTDVYYGGSENDWNKISIGSYNEGLAIATIHFAKESHTHIYTSKTTKAATCTGTGKKTFTCSCGDTYNETIAQLGHKLTTLKVVSATYTSTGLTAGKKCSVCGTITVAQKTIAKLTLGKVSGLKAKKVKVAKSSEITLAWNKVDGAEKYEVYQYVSKKWKKIKTTSNTSYTVKKLKSDKSYKFKVRAVVDGVEGAYSSVLTVETIPETTSKLTLKSGKKQLTASWKSVSDISGYEVQYSTSKKFTKKTTKTVKVKKSSKKTTIKKLTKGKKYYVRVRTYKTVNGKKVYSSWSTVKNVKVK